MLLEKLLDKMYRARAQVFPPAKEEEIRLLRMTLARNKLPPLPSDYMTFLALTDGLIWNGLRFYGVASHERTEQNYAFPSLLEVNTDFAERQRSQGFLLVGEKDEDYIVYNAREKNYQLMDRMDLMADLALPRFFDVLYLFTEDLVKSDSVKELR